MNIPIEKNKRWIAGLNEGIDKLGRELKTEIMKPAGKNCALDILALCEKVLGRKIETIEDLAIAWNLLRDKRNLKGKWELEGNTIRGIFGECGCPLVHSGLIQLHPIQCLCSQGMMETIFSQVAKKTVEVDIRRSIGRGDDVCEILVFIKPSTSVGCLG